MWDENCIAPLKPRIKLISQKVIPIKEISNLISAHVARSDGALLSFWTWSSHPWVNVTVCEAPGLTYMVLSVWKDGYTIKRKKKKMRILKAFNILSNGCIEFLKDF